MKKPESIHPRQQILIPYRQRLSNEMYNNPEFRNALDDIFLKNSTEKSQLVADINASAKKDWHQFIGRDIKIDEQLDMQKIITACVYMAKLLAPFYAGFASWLFNTIKTDISENELVVVFSGRDAQPLMQACTTNQNFLNKKVKLIQLPFNRGNILHFYKRCYDPLMAIEEARKIESFYRKNGLLEKKCVACDFGFFGTLERTHQLVLKSMGVKNDNVYLKHCLVVKMKRNPTDITVFDKAIDERAFKMNTLEKIKEDDKNYYQNIHGYFNTGLIKTQDFFVLDNDVLVSMDKSFIYWLQEIGSGLEESKYYSTRNDSADYNTGTKIKLASWQQLTAYRSITMALTEYLKSKITWKKNDLFLVYQEYIKHNSFWRELIAYEDRASVDWTFKYEKLLKEINQTLYLRGYQGVSIPYDA